MFFWSSDSLFIRSYGVILVPRGFLFIWSSGFGLMDHLDEVQTKSTDACNEIEASSVDQKR